MLYYLYQALHGEASFLRIFKYITVRAVVAFILAFIIVVLVGKPFIDYMRRKKLVDIDDERVRAIQEKNPKFGTPTMGGILIVFSIFVTIMITSVVTNKFIIMLTLVMIVFTGLGFADDYLKWSKKNKEGLSAKKKLIGQIVTGLLISLFIYKFPLLNNEINFSVVNPFVKNSYLNLGPILYSIFIVFVITGVSNAVNITDGLDGLVIGPVMIVSFIMGIVAYLTGHIELSNYLNLYYIDGAGEILVFLSALIGAGLGFLWYNFYPAQVFMGDTGSLPLGGLLGTVAICLKQELLLPIVGIVFVIETLSVIIQVGSYKTRKKRVFKMAPIHHHFEMQGLKETKVTMRFWIISIIVGIAGLIILKLR